MKWDEVGVVPAEDGDFAGVVRGFTADGGDDFVFDVDDTVTGGNFL